jgi:hypothetical protein
MKASMRSCRAAIRDSSWSWFRDKANASIPPVIQRLKRLETFRPNRYQAHNEKPRTEDVQGFSGTGNGVWWRLQKVGIPRPLARATRGLSFSSRDAPGLGAGAQSATGGGTRYRRQNAGGVRIPHVATALKDRVLVVIAPGPVRRT